MSTDNNKQDPKSRKKQDGSFHSKNIKHDHQGESSRAVYGLNQEDVTDKK